MPARYDLLNPATVDAASIEAIVAALKSFDLGDCLDAAFARYPGNCDARDFISPNVAPAKNLRDSIKGVHGDSAAMLRPFLSRMIEHKWVDLEFKRALLANMPDLVLAPIGLQAALI